MKTGVQWLLNAWSRPERQQNENVARALQVAGAYRQVFAETSPEARLVLADLASYCNVATTSFVSADPYTTAFHEGHRDAFLHIAEMLGLAPHDFPNLLKEQNHD